MEFSSIELVTGVYKMTEVFPKTEIYGLSLTTQIRESVVSIPSNISEGAGRRSDSEFKLFLGCAYGSCCELETPLIIANNLKYINAEVLPKCTQKLNEIEKMIYKLIQSIDQ